MVNEKQQTIRLHVEDVMSSHVDPPDSTDFPEAEVDE